MVDRFNIEIECGGFDSACSIASEKCDTGEYVLYSDVEQLEAELDCAKRAVSDVGGIINRLEAENKALKVVLDLCMEIIEDSGVDYDELLKLKQGG